MSFYLKRVYEEAEDSDGLRVLVDRLWPRGVTKRQAHIDVWAKNLAPSTELRKWYDHKPEKWPAFQISYSDELKGNPALSEIRALCSQGRVTLVYGAKDKLHTHALVLKQALESDM